MGVKTLSVCCINRSDPLYGEWSFNTLLFTFPDTIFSFTYRYVETDLLLPVFVI